MGTTNKGDMISIGSTDGLGIAESGNLPRRAPAGIEDAAAGYGEQC